MNKIKALFLGFLTCCCLVVPVYAATYSQNSAYFVLEYRDFPSEVAASSMVVVRENKWYAACCIADHGVEYFEHADCSALVTNGTRAYTKWYGSDLLYDIHAHFIIDEYDNKSYKF